MAILLQISDFDRGVYRIPVNSFTQNDLQSVIDKHEKLYLIRLFGKELYDLFVADVVNFTPQTAVYVDIFNEFIEHTDNNCSVNLYHSEGLKEMLKGIVYFYWTREQYNRNTTVGAKRTKSENSDNQDTTAHNIWSRYNNAGETYEAIQYKLENDTVNYPTYRGVAYKYITIL